MKKFISILLCAVLLSVYLMVFTVPAAAAEYKVNSLAELYTTLEKVKDGDKIEVDGDGTIWEVNKLIFIDASCSIEFNDIIFMIGHDGDYNYYDDSLIEVNEDNVTLDFYNCTFNTEQYDLLYGGDLVSDAWGSAIYIDGNNCTIDGHNSTVFEDCKTNGKYGGAIYDDGYDKTIIRNIEFKDCECTGVGGAIYTEGTNCIVENCKFSGCYAPKGGSNIYSDDYGEVIVIDCKDADGNLIDESTCFNCDLDADTYMRQNFPTCVRHPAYPEEGYYILRSAVDPDYIVVSLNGSINIGLGHINESTSKLLYLEKNPYGQGYKIHMVNINGDFLVGGFMNCATQLRRLPRSGGGVWVSQYWNFESDAPGGDDHYYIHSTDGVWMEACLADGEKPHSGTVVQSNSYFGSTNQVWVLEKVDAPSGFTLAGGNTWIIIAGAVVILGGIVAIVVNNKKKKAVPADGEVTVTETTEKTEE